MLGLVAIKGGTSVHAKVSCNPVSTEVIVSLAIWPAAAAVEQNLQPFLQVGLKI